MESTQIRKRGISLRRHALMPGLHTHTPTPTPTSTGESEQKNKTNSIHERMCMSINDKVKKQRSYRQLLRPLCAHLYAPDHMVHIVDLHTVMPDAAARLGHDSSNFTYLQERDLPQGKEQSDEWEMTIKSILMHAG
eukprot:1158561-Pelagomonas_calceolata.AAC.7